MNLDTQFAEVFQSTSPGGDKHLMGIVALNGDGEAEGELTVSPEWNAPQYFVVKVGGVAAAFKPSAEREYLKHAAGLMLRCEIQADFEPQAWINDHAVPIDDGKATFNALAALISLSFSDFREMFSEGVDFDALATGLPEREAHRGPFEVRIDEAAVVELIEVLTGNELEGSGAVGRATWDTFVDAASGLLKQKKVSEEASPVFDRQRG